MTKTVFVLVDTDGEDLGASVYNNRDTLLDAARELYDLTDRQVEELDLTEELDIIDGKIKILCTTIV